MKTTDPAVTDLVAFLRARLDEDEQVARAADPGPWEVGPTFGARDNRVYVRQEGDLIDTVGTCVIAGQVANMTRFRENATHIARHDPARVLREVAAKRAIVAAVEKYVDPHPGQPCTNEDDSCGPCELHVAATGRVDPYALRILAAVYADHPDYSEEWR